MSTRYDIKPGYGNKGMDMARTLLAERLRAAVVEEIGHADKIEVHFDRDRMPALRMVFDEHTTAWITLWPHGPRWGFEPSLLMQTTRYVYLLTTHLPPRPVRWDSEIELAFKRAQREIATLELVEVP